MVTDVGGEKTHRILDRGRSALQPGQPPLAAKRLARRVGVENHGAGKGLLLRPVAHREVIPCKNEGGGFQPQLRDRPCPRGQFLP